MKKRVYILYVLIFFTVCGSLGSCIKDVYKEDKPDEDPIPSIPDEEEDEKLADLSVSATFDWNEVYISIPLPNGADMNNIQVLFPPLKYDKKFAYSYTFDDCTVMAYSRGFSTINKKWIDYHRFFHVGQEKATGSYPSKTLGYTDGCGNERRFSFGVAIWPDMSNSQIDNFMNPTTHRPDKYYPYLVWKDLVPLIDFGSDIYFHDVNTSKFGNDVNGILEGMKRVQQITKETLGRKMKIMARPNGDNTYCTAAREYEDIVMMAVENNTDIGSPLNIRFNNDIDLKNAAQYRRFVEASPTTEQLWPDINSAASAGTFAWIHDFSHGPAEFQYVLDLFHKINDEYGKDGNDCVWFATLDEIYEYNYLRKNCVIEKNISNNILTLRFSCPSSDLPNELMFHRDFSILVKGITLSNVDVSSGKNIYGISYSEQNDNSWLININCNKSLFDRAERYTSIYEKDRSSSAKEDALYFVNQLKENLRTSFISRIE